MTEYQGDIILYILICMVMASIASQVNKGNGNKAGDRFIYWIISPIIIPIFIILRLIARVFF